MIRPVVAALATACAIAGMVALVDRVRGGSGRESASSPAEAARRFLDRYVEAEGRVARLDQGGDTVSEGQAYAMLLAVAVGDRPRFERVWDWTRANLQRPDGLLSYLWRDGRIVDPEAATDADLDAARALVLAAERFDEDAFASDAKRIAGAVLEREVAVVRHEPVLIAGPWAQATLTVNPSYFSPRSFRVLAAATRDPRWDALVLSSRRITEELLHAQPHLPPDWAKLEPTGEARPASPPHDPSAPARYGFDATRLLVRFAESCDPADRRLAARAWPFLRARANANLAAAYDLAGNPVDAARHALPLVAAAAAAGAAGEDDERRALLRRAEALDAASSTYFGAAWLALGRVMLETDRLGPCAQQELPQSVAP